MTIKHAVRSQSVSVTEVIDAGDRWAIGEGEPDPGWWYALKSAVPQRPERRHNLPNHYLTHGLAQP